MAVLLGVGLGACAHPAPAALPGSGSDLNTLLDHQAQDWNRGDLEGFCSVYAEDATFISPSGVRQGRAQILARYRAKYDTPEKRGVLSFEQIEIRIEGQVASMALKWRIKKADDEAAGHALIVLHHTEVGWRIVQDASM